MLWVKRGQGEGVIEIIGSFDGHGHGRTESLGSFCRKVEGFGVPTIGESKNLLHDVVENDSATEARLNDCGQSGRFVEALVVEAQPLLSQTLETGHKLLFEPDGLIHGFVLGLLANTAYFLETVSTVSSGSPFSTTCHTVSKARKPA